MQTKGHSENSESTDVENASSCSQSMNYVKILKDSLSCLLHTHSSFLYNPKLFILTKKRTVVLKKEKQKKE